MVHILGTLLPENRFVQFALTKFYGVGPHISARICARFQIHDRARIRDLSPQQITSLTAFLSAPSSAPIVPRYPVAPPDFVPSKYQVSPPPLLRREAATLRDLKSPLYHLKIENEKRKEMRDNIAHHRNIGSYRGLRHALGFPVRGQNTQTNAETAKKLNRIERRA